MWEEICYNIRYVIENGRLTNSSWSLRQTAVYYRKSLTTGCDTWIFIQPSQDVQNFLESRPDDMFQNDQCGIHTHMMVFQYSIECWQKYISTLRSALEQLDHKASFAKIGKKIYADDYEVSIKDSQGLHKVQRKLFRARLVVKATMVTVARFQSWCKYMLNLHILETGYVSELFVGLDDISAALTYHEQSLKGLISYSHGMAELLQQMTSYRAMKDLQSSTVALDASLYLLRGIATTSQVQSQSMLTIAQTGSKDSLRIKTLTHIATLYLPPTLIAVSGTYTNLRTSRRSHVCFRLSSAQTSFRLKTRTAISLFRLSSGYSSLSPYQSPLLHSEVCS